MRALILAFVILLAPAAARGADEVPDAAAELKVTVLDQTGAALVIARVTVVDAAGTAQSAQVDGEGVATFAGLVSGTCTLRAEAEAFQSYEGPVTLKKGSNAIGLRLPLAGLTEQVIVTQEQTDLRGNSFTTTLTEAQIAELPDDPDELEALLNQMAGPGATLRVNGFRGGRLPPKSQIRQIRFRMNSYAAENHESGGFGIDIQTKPGVDDWRGMSSFGFRDESMNARNAFAPTVGPEQYRRFGLDFSGPLRKGTTSIAVATDINSSYDSKTIVAASPNEAIVNGQVRRPSDILNATVRLEHALSQKQTMLVEYQRHGDSRKNLGVGDFDLPSRAYTRENSDNLVRAALNGLVAPTIANELKVQYQRADTDVYSLTDDPAIIVVDSFSRGGAGQQQNVETRTFELYDNVDFSFHKKHAVRAGLQLEASWYDTTQLRNGNGTFTFASLNAFDLGLPNTYTQRVGGTPVEFSQYQLGVYVQDDWTISKQLSLSLGLRQELQNTLGDRLNLAPRVGFTWAPNKWTVRGGFGIFNDWYDASVYEQTLFVDGTNQQDVVVLRPGYPDPYAGGILSETLPPSVIRAVSGLSMPYLKQASVGIERNWGDLRLQTSYMIQRGSDTLRSLNANAPVPGEGRPDETTGNITQIESTGRTEADRWQVNLNFAKPQRRFFMGVNYILAHARNYADSPLSLPSNSLDPDVDWGPAAQDIRHRVFAMASFGLPLKLRAFLNTQYQSAAPYNVITGLDNNGDSVTNDRPAGVGRNSARGSASWNLGGRLSRSFSFGPPRPASGQGGPPGGGPIIRRGGGPGGGDGPRMMMGAFDPNAGRYSVEFYVQVFNLLNRVNYQNYSGSLRSPFYGDPTSAGPARRIEIGTMFGF
jgi:hypothetical protein